MAGRGGFPPVYGVPRGTEASIEIMAGRFITGVLLSSKFCSFLEELCVL